MGFLFSKYLVSTFGDRGKPINEVIWRFSNCELRKMLEKEVIRDYKLKKVSIVHIVHHHLHAQGVQHLYKGCISLR